MGCGATAQKKYTAEAPAPNGRAVSPAPSPVPSPKQGKVQEAPAAPEAAADAAAKEVMEPAEGPPSARRMSPLTSPSWRARAAAAAVEGTPSEAPTTEVWADESELHPHEFLVMAAMEEEENPVAEAAPADDAGRSPAHRAIAAELLN